MEEQNQKRTPSYLNAFLTVLLSFGTKYEDFRWFGICVLGFQQP